MRNDSKLFDQVSRILFEKWDPIPVNFNSNLADEYNDYVPHIMEELIISPNSFERIEMELKRLELTLGVEDYPDVERKAIARQLASLSEREGGDWTYDP